MVKKNGKTCLDDERSIGSAAAVWIEIGSRREGERSEMKKLAAPLFKGSRLLEKARCFII
jgi:hypothetical protein